MRLIHGECLQEMDKLIAEKIKVDMICCDLPYGKTLCKWDTVIPFDELWARYNQLVKPNGCVALFGSEPFTSLLICSNIKNFKYNWIYQKNRKTGFFNAKHQPMNDHETISVFYKKQCTYNPQKIVAEKTFRQRFHKAEYSECLGGWVKNAYIQTDDGLRYPKRIIHFNNTAMKQLHPTQKPVELLEYLVKTYTVEGETVLDNCMGSGTTGVACQNLGREFIGIELDKGYFEAARERIGKYA